MAECIGGLATSHSPQLNTLPPVWLLRAEWDRSNPVFEFETLLQRTDLPADLDSQLTIEAFQEKYDRCQSAIGALRDAYNELAPDVVVVVGDDQHEMFPGEVIPAVAVYCDESVDDIPRDVSTLHPSQVPGEWAYHAEVRTTLPTHAALASHIVGSLTDDGFDITQIRRQPEGRTIGHAFTFVLRRIMVDRPAPIVPVMVNTDHVLSAPRPARCWELGRALRSAIDAYPGSDRVLVVGSGGLSHFKLDEALDQQVIQGLLEKDVALLAKLPAEELVLGTSEVRNWIIAAGALTDRQMALVDYVPAYRSEGGTGCGMGFARWS